MVVSLQQRNRTAEGHAGAESIAAANRFAMQGQLIGSTKTISAAVQFVVEVRRTSMPGTVIPAETDIPDTRISALANSSLGARIGPAISATEAELLPGEVQAAIPSFQIFRTQSTNSGCTVLLGSSGITTASADAKAGEFAVPTGCEFPEVLELTDVAIDRLAVGAAEGVLHVRHCCIRTARLEAVPFRRQVGEAFRLTEVSVVVSER